MAETLVKVPGRQRLLFLVLPRFCGVWKGVVVRLVGGVQTSCWVLKQSALPARMCVSGWGCFGGSLLS